VRRGGDLPWWTSRGDNMWGVNSLGGRGAGVGLQGVSSAVACTAQPARDVVLLRAGCLGTFFIPSWDGQSPDQVI